MPYIVLTEEQARIIEQAEGPVEMRDARGQPVARALPLPAVDAEMIARSKESRAIGGPAVPAMQVQAHFQRLAEIATQETLDETEALELLRRMRAGEVV